MVFAINLTRNLLIILLVNKYYNTDEMTSENKMFEIIVHQMNNEYLKLNKIDYEI